MVGLESAGRPIASDRLSGLTERYSHLASLYLRTQVGNKKLGRQPPVLPGGWGGIPDGSGVYYGMEEHGSSHIYFASVDGKIRKVTDGIHVLSSYSMANNGQVAATRSSFKEPSVLVTFNMRDAANMKKLVDVNEDVLAGVQLGDAEELWFSSKDGLKVQGWLIKPAEFDPAKKYPMVLWIPEVRGRCTRWFQLGVSELLGEGMGLVLNPRAQRDTARTSSTGFSIRIPARTMTT